VAAILIARVRLGDLDGKAKLMQNRSPAERCRALEQMWARGLDGDPRAIELIRAANPDTPTPTFLRFETCWSPMIIGAPQARNRVKIRTAVRKCR